MAYWLVKSEPSVYSWAQLQKDGNTLWDGVRSYASRNNLRAMKKGEKVFFYHSNEGLEIVGIAEVSREAFQDPGTDNPAWLAIELKPFKSLKKAVSLDTMKADKRLANLDLVRIGRLSVGTVSDAEYKVIMELSGEKVK